MPIKKSPLDPTAHFLKAYLTLITLIGVFYCHTYKINYNQMADNLEAQVLLSVQADTSSVTQATTDVQGLKTQLDNVNNTPIDQPFKSFKVQLREAIRDAQVLKQQVDAGVANPEAYQAAIKNIGQLKENIREFGLAVRAADPAAPFFAMMTMAKGAAGALQVVTGGMAALGVHSDSVEKTIMKLQGLMAFTQGIDQLVAFSREWKVLGAVIQNNTLVQKANAAATTVAGAVYEAFGVAVEGTSLAFNVLKGAIIATGIGALVIGLVMLVQNFDKIKETILKLIPGLSDVFKWIGKVVNGFTDFIGLTTEAGRAFGALAELAEKQAKKDQDYLDSQGWRYDKYTKKKLESEIEYYKKLKELKDRNDLDDKQRADLANEYRLKLNHEIDEADKDRKKESDKKAEEARKKREEAAKKKEDELKTYQDSIKRNSEEIQKINDEASKKLLESHQGDRTKDLENLEYTHKEQLRNIQDAYDKAKELADKDKRNGLISAAKYASDMAALRMGADAAKKKLAEATKAEEIDINKKYDKQIAEATNQAYQSAYQKEQSNIIKKFDELRKLAADENQLLLIDAAKAKELMDSTTKYNLELNVKKTQTNLIQSETTNKVVNDKQDPTQNDTAESATKKVNDLEAAKRAAENAAFALKLEQDKGDNALIEQETAKHQANISKIEDEGAKARREISDREAAAKKKAIADVSNVLETAADLAGKKSVEGKALAIAGTTIKTYQSATAAYAGMVSEIPGPVGIAAGAIAAAASIASGLKSIQQIASVQIPNHSSSGGGSAPSFQAPTINAVAATPQQTQDVRVTNTGQQQPLKAYITNNDLQNNEQKNNFLNQVSTF